jgi:hypothetical protein
MRQILLIGALGCPALLAACASSNGPPIGKASALPPAPPVRPAPPAPTHDWRALVVLPFGTLLKDVPYQLGEIVLFHGAGGGGREDRECYALQRAAMPRWFGLKVDEYSLCFSSDRLDRIEASVSLPPGSAPPPVPIGGPQGPPARQLPTGAAGGTGPLRSTPG